MITKIMVNNDEVTLPNEVAENLNDYFVNVGNNLVKKTTFVSKTIYTLPKCLSL